MCAKETTIILTALSDDELQKEFPHMVEDLSEKQDDTIKRLKEDIVPVGDSSTPDSAAFQAQEVTEEKAEEKDRDFVHDCRLVEHDGVVYYVDEEGLWKKEANAESELLTAGSALNLSTDGRVIYYGVYNKTVSRTYYSSKIENYQYDMYKYDLSTDANEKLMSFVEAGRPICAVGDTVYYTDFPDDFDGNMAGLAQGICSYNTATGEKKYLCDGANLTASYDGKIFYRQIMPAGGNMGIHQIHCYDTQTESSTIISEDNAMSFKVINGKLYYVILNDFNVGIQGSSNVKLCCYDIATAETQVLLENSEKLLGLEDYDDKYVVSYNDNEKVFNRTDISTLEAEQIPLSEFGNAGKFPSVFRDKTESCIVFGTDTTKQIYTVDDSGSSVVSHGSLSCQSVIAFKNQTIFYTDPGDNNYYTGHIRYKSLK